MTSPDQTVQILIAIKTPRQQLLLISSPIRIDHLQRFLGVAARWSLLLATVGIS